MKMKDFLRSPMATALLFVLAAALLLGGTITGVRAAPLIESQFYTAGVELYSINIQLLENGTVVSGNGETGALLTRMIPEGEMLQIGRTYPEELAVRNNGTIDEYVRVRIFKYWVDENGNKMTDRDPALIDLHLITGEGWLLDELASTPERTVLYYNRPVPGSGGVTSLFSDTLTLNGGIGLKAREIRSTETRDGVTYTTIETVYDYDGVSFRLDVQVDGVQDHNPEAAILSAWGRHVTVQDKVLSLGEEAAG